MNKIPTVFQRGPDFLVRDEVHPDCAWVLAYEGKTTEKLDGTNVRFTVRSGTLVRVEKRRNPTKAQKALGITDGWYVDADESAAENKWLLKAASNTDIADWADGEHSCEAMGPKIQGNGLGLDAHICVPFKEVPSFDAVLRTFEGLKQFLKDADSVFAPGHAPEGIVFHHHDGRRAKLKRKDFLR